MLTIYGVIIYEIQKIVIRRVRGSNQPVLTRYKSLPVIQAGVTCIEFHFMKDNRYMRGLNPKHISYTDTRKMLNDQNESLMLIIAIFDVFRLGIKQSS